MDLSYQNVSFWAYFLEIPWPVHPHACGELNNMLGLVETKVPEETETELKKIFQIYTGNI